jgi:hypothetical protein
LTGNAARLVRGTGFQERDELTNVRRTQICQESPREGRLDGMVDRTGG